VRGTAYLCPRGEKLNYPTAAGTDKNGEPVGYDYDTLKTDKRAYADAFAVQYRNNDAVNGKAIVEYYGDRMLVQNPPAPPLESDELDKVYALPYMRDYHPMYEKEGGVPAITEVKFSVTHNRGCFGGCNFCALAFHQGRSVRSRSIESVVSEAKLITEMSDFKGYIHDVGGPTANFRHPACKKQLKSGVCQNRRCLVPTPCPNLEVDHSEYEELLSRIKALPGVKKVFIRSGIRFDYLIYDKDDSFFRTLVRDHISGQLKVAPEHCTSHVLSCMGKPDNTVYEKFRKKFFALTDEAGLKQYLVPYLMSSHPGSTLEDAIELALYMKSIGLSPEQVQDFYPTPGTASTVMYYTGFDPLTGKKIYTPTDYREKQMQRALLQWRRPENAPLVREALREAGREDLIGYGGDCLVKPEKSRKTQDKDKHQNKNKGGRSTARLNNRDGRGQKNGKNSEKLKSSSNKTSQNSGKNKADAKKMSAYSEKNRADAKKPSAYSEKNNFVPKKTSTGGKNNSVPKKTHNNGVKGKSK
jgi:uncharacterized radical SAM protein YgiQ